MENENNEYYPNYSGFEFLLKKSRGKKKKRSRKAKTQNSVTSSETKSEEGTLDEANLTDDNNSGAEDTEEGSSKDAVMLRANVDDAADNENRISLDAMMSAAPEYEIDKKIEDEENELENSMDKMNIEDELLDTVDNIYSKREYSLLNSRALPKEAMTYELETFDKNALIIFNQKEIDGHQPRLGTEKDVDALTRTFKNFGFEVTPHHNLTKDGLFEELKNCK